MRVAFLLVFVLASYLGLSGAESAESRPRSVLVMIQSDARGTFHTGVFAGLRSALHDSERAPVSIFAENLDLNRFSGARYDVSLLSHLKIKYNDKPIGAIVALGTGSLRYVLKTRAALWPDVPVVFSMVDEKTYNELTLPRDVTGSVVRLTLADMVRAARAVDPGLERVALVGDPLETQAAFRHFKDEIPSAAKGLELIDLLGMPMAELRLKLAQLPKHTVILYTSIYSDGRGTYFPPSDGAVMIADVANRPIIVTAESFFGRGTTGGFMMVAEEVGRRAGSIALRIINGEDPAVIPPRVDDVVKPVFDWRQLERWGVDQSTLPEGSEIRYRKASLWEEHRWYISSICAAFLILVGLVGVLLHERQSRINAEMRAGQRMSELAHINRRATAGEMSAAIAHELNQPLGAILNNAETAKMLLTAGEPDISELREIIDDIRRDDQRAGEIVRGLRKLVSKKLETFEEVDLNEITRDALAIADIQARTQGITLHSNFTNEPLSVSGDAVQLQQVILNLAINGIEATNSQNPRDIVTRTTRADSKTAEFSIYDFGVGIPVDKLAIIFDPFVTTKPNGMGMGLSLARTIIEAHSGTIWAENAASGGAIVRFRLPLVRQLTG